MKYIIVERRSLMTDMEIPIIFPENVSHDEFLKMYKKEDIVSAGFVYFHEDGKAKCQGRSASLGLSMREIDNKRINGILRSR